MRIEIEYARNIPEIACVLEVSSVPRFGTVLLLGFPEEINLIPGTEKENSGTQEGPSPFHPHNNDEHKPRIPRHTLLAFKSLKHIYSTFK